MSSGTKAMSTGIAKATNNWGPFTLSSVACRNEFDSEELME
jgi:hypothetical protein